VHSLGNAEISKVMAEMSANPEFQSLLRQDAAALLWSVEPLAIIWASPAAQDFARSIVTDSSGTVSGSFPAFSQIQALAKGRAPRAGQRLEKLRFDSNALAPLATCAVRIVALPGGGEALLVTFLGKPPRVASPPLVAKPAQATQPAPAPAPAPASEAFQTARIAQAPPPAAPAQAAAPVPQQPQPAAPLAPKPPKRIVRFLWETDRDGRFTSVSENFAEVVGRGSAAIIGMTINEVLATRARDPLDIVVELFSRGETWSGRTLYWRIADSDEAVRIDLAGLPVYDRTRNLVGLRGFGLCRPDEVTAWKLPEPEPAPAAEVQVELVAEAASDEPPGEVDAGRLPFEVAGEAAAETAEAEAVAEGIPGRDLETPEHAVASVAQEGTPSEAPRSGIIEDSQPSGYESVPEAPAESPAAPPGEPAQAPLLEEATEEAAAPQATTARVIASFSGFVGATLGAAAPVPLKIIEEDLAESSRVFGDADADAAAAGEERPAAPPQVDQEPPRTASAQAQRQAHIVPSKSVDEEKQVYAVVEPAVKVVETGKGGVKPLSHAERSAFREIARALGARFEDGENERAASSAAVEQAAPPPEEQPATRPRAEAEDEKSDETDAADQNEPETLSSGQAEEAAEGEASGREERDQDFGETKPPEAVILSAANDSAPDISRVLDRLPVGVIVHRGEAALFANRFILDLVGYEDLQAFEEEGGLPRLFRARPAALARAAFDVTAPLAIGTREGESLAVEVRLTTVDWGGTPASMLMLRKVCESDPDLRLRAMELDMAAREQRLREQSAILDTATDGVIVLDDRGRILSLNRAAEALFGYEQNEVAGEPLMMLLATESHLAALDYLEGMRGEGMRSLLNDGREVLARVRQGGTIPLFMTLGSIADGSERKFCAVLRDITAFKKAEGELIAAKRAAEHASAQKSDFLAKISHEIRTPLNAIIGFAEVMIEERFGAIGNERYKDYVSDIHSSGQHVISLVNDLLDLAKIEAGRMELTFTSVQVNELVAACVALLQPQAARDRIVLRTSFADKLPPVVADERSLRQITLNLLSNAVKFTDAGGQVIVSTAMTDAGEVVFRVRDTGIGMSETEVEAALEPFRQLATSRKGGGTGLGLPLTKALVEANRGALTISSRKDEGTLVEVVFPPTRVLAE
jgi:PAS domain S-box-containing protein